MTRNSAQAGVSQGRNALSITFIETFLSGETASGLFLAGSRPDAVVPVGHYSEAAVLALPDGQRHHVTAASYPLKAKKRNDAEIVEVPFIVFDDLDPKVFRDEGIEPSWVMETSAGNYQCGFAFDPPLSPAVAQGIHAALSNDPRVGVGLHSLGQYFRLPSGCSDKPGKESFATRLVEFGEAYQDIRVLEPFLKTPAPASASSANGAQVSPEIVRKIVALLPNDARFNAREEWLRMAHAISGALEDQGEAEAIWLDWCEQAAQTPGEPERVWETLPESRASASTLRRLVEERYGINSDQYNQVQEMMAQEAFPAVDEAAVPSPKTGRMYTLEDFWAFAPAHDFILEETGIHWPAASVDARVPWPTGANGKPMKPSLWLDRHRSVSQETWLPGYPKVIDGMVVKGTGMVPSPKGRIFNLYTAPEIEAGDATKAGVWEAHVRRLYPMEADHIFDWLAFKVQFPGDKINHCLVLGGAQGIGKDTLLAPVVRAVGTGNCHEVSPTGLKSSFNGYVRAVILRISELRDLGEISKYAMYDATKTLMAAPPETLTVNEKHKLPYDVPNLVGVVLTSNYLAEGLYLPPEDRRHYVAWSQEPGAGEPGAADVSYFDAIWSWLEEQGGYGHVAAFLRERDLSGFNPKAPPTKTKAWRDIVYAGRSSAETDLEDALDALGRPAAFTLEELSAAAGQALRDWLAERKNRQLVPGKMTAVGYERSENPNRRDGDWRVHGKKVAIYVRRGMSVPEQEAEAKRILGAIEQVFEALKAQDEPDPGPF